MKKILIPLLFLLGGCNCGPVIKYEFPDPPKDVITKCPDLAEIDGSKVTMSDLLNTVSLNYSRYYVCAATVDAWQSWYEQQKVNYAALHPPSN